MSGGNDAEIAELKERLAKLEAEAAPPQQLPPATPRKAKGGCGPFMLFIGAIIVVLVALGQLVTRFDNGQSAVTVDPLADVRTKVDHSEAAKISRNGLDRALNDRYPQGSRVIDYMAFHFENEPTYCGTVRPRGSGTMHRFLARREFAVIEGDVTAKDFRTFWVVCQAAGYK